MFSNGLVLARSAKDTFDQAAFPVDSTAKAVALVVAVFAFSAARSNDVGMRVTRSGRDSALGRFAGFGVNLAIAFAAGSAANYLVLNHYGVQTPNSDPYYKKIATQPVPAHVAQIPTEEPKAPARKPVNPNGSKCVFQIDPTAKPCP